MRKGIIKILIITIRFFSIRNASDMYLTPHYGRIFSYDRELNDYFTKNNLNIFGVSADFISNKNNIGLFVDFSSFSFEVKENINRSNLTSNIDGKWFTLGLTNHLNFFQLPIEVVTKIGPTLHINSYTEKLNYDSYLA
ncbi:MAG: hypothetical protein K9N00_00025 [Candidatus Marinimicrobia bacterium]|nr:hypothetical protein [Candidatus Neomarinimicrobiota bacterium]